MPVHVRLGGTSKAGLPNEENALHDPWPLPTSLALSGRHLDSCSSSPEGRWEWLSEAASIFNQTPDDELIRAACSGGSADGIWPFDDETQTIKRLKMS